MQYSPGAAGLGEKVVELAEALHPIVIVGIDDGEGGVDHVPVSDDGLACAPGLDPPLGHRIALGQIVQVLIGIAHLHVGLNPAADPGLEVGLNFALDDEHHGLKPGPPGIKHRVVQNDLAVGSPPDPSA